MTEADIRINKVQISCAIELDNPTSEKARQALATFAEQRYLHQTFAQHSDGRVISHTDLSQELALDPPAEWSQAERWRVHFHVPVDADRLVRRPARIRRVDSQRKFANNAIAAVLRGGRGEFPRFAL